MLDFLEFEVYFFEHFFGRVIAIYLLLIINIFYINLFEFANNSTKALTIVSVIILEFTIPAHQIQGVHVLGNRQNLQRRLLLAFLIYIINLVDQVGVPLLEGLLVLGDQVVK